MKVIKGDLIEMALDGEFDVIIHGCNCFGKFGAGIAKQIAAEWPVVIGADAKAGGADKLGTYSACRVGDKHGGWLCVVNAYTQFGYGRGRMNADYKAIQSVFRKIKRDFGGEKIGIPMIGAGLAGGSWKIISEIIDTEMGNSDLTLVLFDKRR
jgi:O-acetyl-ADP-ribose deacetylase (regulator of RNase III)